MRIVCIHNNYVTCIQKGLYRHSYRGDYKQWTGLLEWNTGLDYWNELFCVFLPFLCACLIVTQHTSYAWVVYTTCMAVALDRLAVMHQNQEPKSYFIIQL